MAARAPIRGGNGGSRRRVPRFQTQAPVDITVVRAGVADKVPGRSVNVCERGVSAMMAGELLPGEAVEIEMQLAPDAEALRARATVKYQESLRCGLEFTGLSAEQRMAIRSWAKQSKAEAESGTVPVVAVEPVVAAEKVATTPKPESGQASRSGLSGKRRRRLGFAAGIVFAFLAITTAGIFWWHWNRSWEELESGLRRHTSIAGEKPPAHVPTQVMQKLLIHRVEPKYPSDAEKDKLQGIIALDVVVGTDGSVVSTRALNGPEVLARAAADALRWWKFEPYRENGKPEAVETTMAVEFKR